MEHSKIKLLSAAIMLSGLLSVSPVLADEPSEFPIEVKDAQTVDGGGFSEKTGGVYKVIKGGSLTLSPSTENAVMEFKKNATLENGASINVEQGGKLIITDGDKKYTFSENQAANGGAIYAELTNFENAAIEALNVAGSTFSKNQATTNGGAIYAAFVPQEGNNNIVTSAINSNVFEGNTAQNGGAVYAEVRDGNKVISLDFNANSFYKNVATENGGAISVVSLGSEKLTTQINNSHFNENSAKNGGAVYAQITEGNQENILNVENNNFASNVATENGGAIYAETAGEGKLTATVSNNTFKENKAANGGAVYIKNTNSNIGSSFTTSNNTFSKNTASQNGGAFYADNTILVVDNSTFEENSANGLGGAIYAPNSEVLATDTNFLNNSAGNGSAIYAKRMTITAKNQDVNISGNNGYALVSTDGDIEFNAAKDKTITIDNDILVSSSDSIAMIDFSNAGTYQFNGRVDMESPYAAALFFDEDASGATVKLGTTAATGTFCIQQEVANVTLDLQNKHAGDTITVPYLISFSKDSTLNVKVDYDVTANAIDNLIIGANQYGSGDDKKGGVVQNINFDLNNIEVLHDDETWGSDELKDTTRQVRYLAAGSDVVNNTTKNGTYRSDDGVTYTFAVDENDKGLLNITRTEDGMTLEEAVADADRKAYTIRRGDYVLTDESTGLGTINKDKAEFTIRGQGKYSLDGNQKDGIAVNGANQILNITDIKEVRNFKTAVTNSGKLNVENVTFINNEKDLVNTGTAYITNSTLNGEVENNGELNLYGASTVKNIVGDNGKLIIGTIQSEDPEIPQTFTNLVFDEENGIIQNKVTINENGSLEIYADKLNASVVNNNVLTLKGHADKDVSENKKYTENDNKIEGDGTTNIDGSIKTTKKIGSKYIVVNTDSSLAAQSAEFVGGEVTNNGEVTLNQGTLGNKIIGGKLTLENNIVTNADNLLADDIISNGKLELTGGTVTKDINSSVENNLKVIVSGDVKNEANVNKKIEVKSKAKYTTSADSIYDVSDSIQTANQSIVELNGGTLKEDRIYGLGSLAISDTVYFDFDNSEATTKVLQNITINEDATFVPFATYTGEKNSITAKDNSTIDLMNGNVNPVNLAKLTIAKDDDVKDVLNVKADYKDTFNVKDVNSVEGNVNISELDLTTAEDVDSYEFTNTLADKVTLKPVGVKMNENSDKNAVYYKNDNGIGLINIVTLGGLTEAVKIVNNEGNDLAYLMKSDEVLDNVTSLTGGDMTVLGNGNSITGKALIVGNGNDEVDLGFVNTNLKNIDLNEANPYSLVVNEKANVAIYAKDNDVVVAGPIKLNGTDADNNAFLGFGANEGKTVTIDGNITSNNIENEVNFDGKGTIIANGIFDPFTAEVSTTLVKNNYDYAITYNVNEGGVLRYTNDKYLYEQDNHDVAGNVRLNTINLNGGTLDLVNGAANTIALADFNVHKDSNLMLDVDLANATMDRISTPATTVNGNLNITKLNLISDATGDETTINFTDDVNLKDKVQYIGEKEGLVAKSPIYRYNVDYKADNGDFSFTRKGGYEGFNPAVYGSAVAMQGLYYTQLNNYNIALANVDQTMLKTKAQRNAEKYGNKYAYDGDETQVFSPLYVQEKNAGAWFKPYVSTERVNLKDGPDVDNTMYGALFGGDSDVITVGGWDTQYSVYAGYNGSHQAFDGNEIYQNGGVLGLTATAYKGNFFTALTANVGMHGANIKTDVGNNDLNTLTTGVASKTGYNWELADGKFIIQPSWMMSYTFINPFDDYTLGNGVRIKNDSLHALQLAPGLKFIGNTANGWQPYLGAQMVWNIVDDTKVKANEVNLPETSTKAYVEYGLGVQKSAGERFTGFGQAMVRNGGRTGVVFTLGGRWAIGTLDR